MKRLAARSSVLVSSAALCLASSLVVSLSLQFFDQAFAQTSTADCTRSYSPLNVIRLVGGVWQVGAENSLVQWTALSCKPGLLPAFYDPFNQEAQEEQGQAHVGKSASFVFYPSAKVPDGVRFTAEPQDLFEPNRIDVNFTGAGQAFLDGSVYERYPTKINGLDVEIDSEPTSPAKASALETLEIFTQLFPKHTAAMAESSIGKIQVVLARNSTEKFQSEPLRANGQHHPQYLWSVLFSEDGWDTLSHSFHEIGGLFRAQKNQYSQGQTWMASYDQMEKVANTSAEKQKQQCLNIERAIWSLQDTVKQNDGDASHKIETYIEDGGESGWSVYAWGSAYYWKKINARLEELKLPTVYDLIDSMPVQYGEVSESAAIASQGLGAGLDGVDLSASASGKMIADKDSKNKDLDKLIAAYRKLSPKHAKVFEHLATRYFRQKSLSQLLKETQSEASQLGCQPN